MKRSLTLQDAVLKKMNFEALDFVKENLTNGKTFAHLLLKKQAIDDGNVSVYLPPEVEHTKEKKFRESIFMYYKGSPYESSDELMAEYISQYLHKDKKNICIFENFNSSPTDINFLENFKGKEETFIYKNEVYHLLRNKDAYTPKVEHYIKKTNFVWIFIAALSSFSEKEYETAVSDQVSLETLEDLAERAEKILIGAFDGEGYLIWEREHT